MLLGNLSKKNQYNCVEFEEICATDINKSITDYGLPVLIDGQFVYSLDGTSEYKHEMNVYKLDLCTKKWQLAYEARGLHSGFDERLRREVAHYENRLFMFGGIHKIVQSKDMFLDTFEVSHI